MLFNEYNLTMKILRVIVGIALIASLLVTMFVGKYKILEDIEILEQKQYKGIITLWHVDGFEGGSGSRKQFLLKVAREFEKQNQGVLVMVTNHTFTSVKESINNGQMPDLISYSNGTEITGAMELDNERKVVSGFIGQKNYATAWCRGGYVLIKNNNAKDNEQNTIIVSQAEYTQPLVALMLEGLEFDNIEVYEPMDAYVKFTANKTAYFLGTQRDVVRLNNRGMQVDCQPLTAFNDLYQYISLTGQDQDKNVYAKKFIDYLLSDNVQIQLNKICMLSPYLSVENQIESLNAMQKVSGFKSISAFCHADELKQIQTISLSAIKGNQEDINKIKNMLV